MIMPSLLDAMNDFNCHGLGRKDELMMRQNCRIVDHAIKKETWQESLTEIK